MNVNSENYGNAEDPFDSWAANRDRHWENSNSARYVSADVVGYEDLDDHGSWRQTPDNGNVWYPRTSVLGDCSIVYVRQQRSKKGHKIESYPKTDAGIRDIDLHPDLAVLVKEYIGFRKNGFLFETSGGLPMSPRNIVRDSLHPILKEMGREAAGFQAIRGCRGLRRDH